MDNKQKRKLFKFIYRTISLLLLVSIAFAIYLSAKTIQTNTATYTWLDVSIISIHVVWLIILLCDNIKTSRLKNKYNLAKFICLVTLVSVIGLASLFGLNYFNKIILASTNVLSLVFFVLNGIFIIINFNVGLKVSKLYQNTTITIDSVVETPNYDDELLLKKKLNELNRKLEIKKVQEKIDQITQELDIKN